MGVIDLYNRLKKDKTPGGGSSEVIYSLEERKIGKWINDKPLYEKTVVLDNPDNTSYDQFAIAHGIENIESCVDFKGFLEIIHYYHNRLTELI